MQKEAKGTHGPFVKLSNLKTKVNGVEIKKVTFLVCVHGENAWDGKNAWDGLHKTDNCLILPVNTKMLQEDAILRLDAKLSLVMMVIRSSNHLPVFGSI